MLVFNEMVMYLPSIVERGDSAINLMNHFLAPVVQRVDNASHRINSYPVESVVCFNHLIAIYTLDSVVQYLNNWSLVEKC